MAASKYIVLEDLVNGWSAQSGELPLLTLRRICDWAIYGRFPKRTFLLPNGREIDVLELRWAMQREIGEHAPMDRDYAAKLLEGAIVSKAGIRSFCEHLGVEPPPGAQSLKSRVLRLMRGPKHLGHPDCPDGAAAAVRREARDLAMVGLGALEELVAIRRHPTQGIKESEIDAWRRRYDDVRTNVEASDDPELRTELGALESEWNSLTTIEEPASEAASRQSQLSDPPKKRGVGRPPGSGSLESKDLELVEEMRADMLSGKHTSLAGAARVRVSRADGGGTEESKVRRLVARYNERYPD